MLLSRGDSVEGKTAIVSGAGNVAIYTVEKAIMMGAKVLTLSDSSGFIYDPNGIDEEKLEFVKHIKEVKRDRISKYVEKYPNATFHPDQRPWGVPADLAFPSATQNEISEEDANLLIKNGIVAVSEGANMPTVLEGARAFRRAGILYGPAKAANAGGVAVSGLEQSQNSLRLSWSREEVDLRLQTIMKEIHEKCRKHGKTDMGVDYVRGANIAGFLKVADAMLSYGIV